MKKIIGLLAVLFITVNVFGQTKGARYCNFTMNKSYEVHQTHYFKISGIQYATAYDSRVEGGVTTLETTPTNPKDSVGRTISLYRQDGNTWVRVSDVIKTDYLKIENDVWSYEYYRDNMHYQIGRSDMNEVASCKGIGYSSVEIKQNGDIIIYMLSFYGVVGVDDEHQYKWETYRLKLQDDGTYVSNKIHTPKLKMKAIK